MLHNVVNFTFANVKHNSYIDMMQCVCVRLCYTRNTDYDTLKMSLINLFLIPGSSGHVAFFAHKGDQQIIDHTDEVIKFGTVVTNIGGAFDPQTGVFTAKERGLYVFSATLSILSRTSTEAIFDFRKNDDSLAYIKTDAHGVQNENDMASGTVNVELEVGDRVYIICMHSYYTGTLVGAAQFSYFSGFKLY